MCYNHDCLLLVESNGHSCRRVDHCGESLSVVVHILDEDVVCDISVSDACDHGRMVFSCGSYQGT